MAYGIETPKVIRPNDLKGLIYRLKQTPNKIRMKKIFIISAIFLFGLAVNTSAQANKNTTAFSIADSSSYIDKYRFEGLPFEYMEVFVKDKKLSYSGGQFNGFLNPVVDKRDVFDAEGGATFTFLRNKERKVAELQIDYMGQTYYGVREAKK